MALSKRWEQTGWVLAGLAWINIVVVAVAYLLYPGYIDHGEPSISSMAWKMLGGAPVYYPFDSPERITNVYGPLTFLWHAWPLALFGGSISASKAAAALGAILITPALFLLARKAGAGAGWVLAFLTGIYTVNLAFAVVIRPDALLILMVAMATLAAARAESWGAKATLAIGLCAGLAVDLKAHGALYIAPVALFHLMGDWKRLPLMAVTAALAASVFFALPLFPLADYLVWFGPMSRKENLWLSGWLWEWAMYLLPLIFAALGPKRTRSAGEWAYLGGYAFCLALSLFPATKNGGGSHYFFPFLPLAADLIRREAEHGGFVKARRIAVTVFALIVLAGSYQSERRFFKKLEWAKSKEVAAEVGAILDRYSGKRVQMSVGRVDSDQGAQLSYHYYSWRNLPVFRGNPFTLDAGVMMELTKLGAPFPQEAVDRIASCHTQVWLVPKGGEPFSLIGYYNQQVFPQAARDAFRAHHRLVETGQFFDVWECS